MGLMNRTTSVGRRNSNFRSNPYNSVSSPKTSAQVPDHDPIKVAGMIADIPKDVESNHHRRHPKRTKKGSWCSWTKFFLLVIFSLIGGCAYVYYHERALLLKQLIEQDNTMRELEINLSMQFDEKIKRLREENTDLQRKSDEGNDLKVQNQNLKDENHRLQNQVKDGKSELKRKEHSEKKLEQQKITLKQNIQKLSKKAVLEKFGPGPHNVELHVRFDSHKGEVDQGWILLELAPLDEMPHATHWFLEQVSRKLYDGNSFNRNPGHIIQGGPVENFLTDSKHPPSREKFKNEGFDSILFQEYSPKFPHQKYTVGYSGRPGGPDFYINIKDNTKLHGPGGQKFGDASEADVCFAKVKKGIDLVDRISKLPVNNDKGLKSNVAIVTAKIINPKH